MTEKLGRFQFLVHRVMDGYFYEITTPEELRVVSKEIFESPGRARLAALGHISLLEKGEQYVETV